MKYSMQWQVVFVVISISFFLNIYMFTFLLYPATSRNNHVADGKSLDKNKQNQLTLVILIMTAPGNQVRRDAIRQTWASKLPSAQSRVYFVLGSQNLDKVLLRNVFSEQQINADMIILGNIKDSYFKLTEKIVEGISVVLERHNVTYIMKCDDDTFIDSVKLFEKLNTLPASKLYWGYFTGAARVKTQGQWAEPNYHLCDRYLPYARGGGYVLTQDLAQYILTNRNLLQTYNSEDVTIGVWLAPLDITRLHDVGFDTEAKSRGCLNHHIVSHKQTVNDMTSKHESLESTGRLCAHEVVYKKEYIYNWDVPPSQCCTVKT